MKRSMMCLLGLSISLWMGLSACSPTEKKAAAPETAKEPAQVEETAMVAQEDSAADMARLLTPETLNAQAPELFNVEIETTKGRIVVEMHRDWAPNGVDRFYNLVEAGFFKDIALFRMVKGFVVQFGIHGTPLVSSVWREASIQDDPVKTTNARGTLTLQRPAPIRARRSCLSIWAIMPCSISRGFRRLERLHRGWMSSTRSITNTASAQTKARFKKRAMHTSKRNSQGSITSFR